ncbi:bifunctional dTDP-4-dehydrorhamnose 3,5-epimerase family protein/NAD(P)-dependent oxidoreductase [Citricoccus sp. I39-566]|uniref:bifunctional dTDP-4-dehydrorhamnose 3,5-epimerase family protein/NAD(P)-dependent oxidoreductase n=1 Tax=Citricoccus sp. I39-566 TaxID=3073268 RepID=UPI00286B59BA|nr:bifunctional dTDP-4-dehydrorhamnose 3,5-epimerase family protein/NAD(P)-dependent oxidoreductase [Citricoccus sp. I39-566]WMY78064.1 bifunctional dTDP-4-dehydrorhamnose 3,5-epimerase family protein/NAD(P)-dependent oxidoreductase [Citricoccus sp. I39-566]
MGTPQTAGQESTTAAVHFSKHLSGQPTTIPGLTLFDLPVHGDNRGWFKENWQRQKMTELGLPDFGPVQNNISFNASRGTTRGIHAEPWDKYISVATGSVFGAWVDLRQGTTFGRVFTAVIDPSTAVYVPRGVGNAFQSLEDNTAYTYLVNDHWSAEAQAEYTFLNLADSTAAFNWPLPLEEAELSDKDRIHPPLTEVVPMAPTTTLVLGATGQLGRALSRQLADRPGVEFLGRGGFDLADPAAVESIDWRRVGTVVNAAAYTAVDEAETENGGQAAWAANAEGVARLARACAEHQVTLIHVSTDYVFDGTKDSAYDESDTLRPVNAYGTSKAAGDLAVGVVPRHYLLRTSWVIGEGKNFVRTMQQLVEGGITPSVVSDQVGRLTFTRDLAEAIVHLRNGDAPYGTYNVTSGGAPGSWAEVARRVYAHAGRSPQDVTEVTTEEYFAGKSVARRPMNSVLDLAKLEATGFTPRGQWEALGEYLAASRP